MVHTIMIMIFSPASVISQSDALAHLADSDPHSAFVFLTLLYTSENVQKQ